MPIALHKGAHKENFQFFYFIGSHTHPIHTNQSLCNIGVWWIPRKLEVFKVNVVWKIARGSWLCKNQNDMLQAWRAYGGATKIVSNVHFCKIGALGEEFPI